MLINLFVLAVVNGLLGASCCLNLRHLHFPNIKNSRISKFYRMHWKNHISHKTLINTLGVSFLDIAVGTIAIAFDVL